MKEITMNSQTANYDQLCALIAFESRLLVLHSQLKWGIQTSCHVEQIGWELGWSQCSKISDISISCADVLSSVNGLGEEMLPDAWADEVACGDYDRCGYKKELSEIEEEKISDDKIELNNVIFRMLQSSPLNTAGNVYIQDILPNDANYCVRQKDGDEAVIAVFNSLNDAITAASYSASHNGGYGDVCIITSFLPATHHDFNNWLID